MHRGSIIRKPRTTNARLFHACTLLLLPVYSSAREYDCIKERAVYAQHVSIRDFTGSKVPSGSIIILLCCRSRSKTLFKNMKKRRRGKRNEATLWLTILSGNGEPRGGSRRQEEIYFAGVLARRRVSMPIYGRLDASASSNLILSSAYQDRVDGPESPSTANGAVKPPRRPLIVSRDVETVSFARNAR